ncbi:MAG: hypothetical protein QCI38_09315, partial [Candidatus Thermoplasmatota archaeon]|nr:hypothetical protein [Candidatus Thermoplasmatota archaeon]
MDTNRDITLTANALELDVRDGGNNPVPAAEVTIEGGYETIMHPTNPDGTITVWCGYQVRVDGVIVNEYPTHTISAYKELSDLTTIWCDPVSVVMSQTRGVTLCLQYFLDDAESDYGFWTVDGTLGEWALVDIDGFTAWAVESYNWANTSMASWEIGGLNAGETLSLSADLSGYMRPERTYTWYWNDWAA